MVRLSVTLSDLVDMVDMVDLDMVDIDMVDIDMVDKEMVDTDIVDMDMVDNGICTWIISRTFGLVTGEVQKGTKAKKLHLHNT